MIQFKTREQAEQYLKLVNIWIPFKLKKRGEHLLKMNCKVMGGEWLGKRDGDGDWTVWKQYWTQEMIDDLKKLPNMDDIQEMENVIITNMQRKQKLDYILDDIPMYKKTSFIPPFKFNDIEIDVNDISNNIKKQIENVRKSKS